MIENFEKIKITDIEDLKDNIKYIEGLVRRSKEYKIYLPYVYNTLGIKYCDYFEDWDSSEIKTEFHHIIFLHDLVKIVGVKMLLELKPGEFILPSDIAREIILLHFEDLIPGAILTTTIHQALHAGKYTIKQKSKSINLGNYKELVNRYGHLMREDHISTIAYFLDDDKKEKLINLWKNKQEK